MASSNFLNDVLASLPAVIAILSAVAMSGWCLIKYCERQQLWTLRLVLSLYQPYLLAPWILSSSAFVAILLEDLGHGLTSNSAALYCSRSMALIVLLLGIGRAIGTLWMTSYLSLRWKAWSGPSRTGISPVMGTYIGRASDWKDLDATLRAMIREHPVERFAHALSSNRNCIERDPTDLLRAQCDQALLPQSKGGVKDGVFQPWSNNEAVSLLWGEDLGFCRRCSRGIIAVPPYLLTASPKLKNGVDARPLSLAFGIIARNKGLEPHRLICNLKPKNTFRVWEEHGCWPHVSKTLRSYYYTEVNKAFHLLGESFVVAVTELALLIADVDSQVLERWLNLKFEHQDLGLNLRISALGATPEELGRLYRGQYAAMLISLSLFHPGVRIRPELSVFEAVCKLEGKNLPSWLSSDIRLQAQKDEEAHVYGPSLCPLIDAII